MNVFFSRIPAAAVKDFFDGKQYANIPHAMAGDEIVEDFAAPRLMRFTDCSFIKNGEAYIQFAKRGDALPLPAYVPFGVSIINMPDDTITIIHTEVGMAHGASVLQEVE